MIVNNRLIRIGIVAVSVAAGLAIADSVKRPGDCPRGSRGCGCQMSFRTADGGRTTEDELAEAGQFWDMVTSEDDTQLFFVMLDGGWSQIGKGWGDGGLPYLARYAGPQRVLALPDGGHLTEVGFPDGGTLCYELPLGQ